jgi:PAS domain S-box-containing protein
MKIRTRFIAITFLFGLILLGTSVSVLVTDRQVRRTSRQEEMARELELEAYELSFYSNDYLLYREYQQLSRWDAVYASFVQHLIGLNPGSAEQRALVHQLKTDQERLNAVFTEVRATLEGASPPRRGALDPDLLRVSWSRMEVQSQGMIFDASRLSQMLRDRVDHLKRTNRRLILTIIGAFGVFLLANFILTYRRTLQAIVELQAGTRMIGSGNLEHVIEARGADEIGDLVRAFNRMTASLKEVTASKADLEKEIAERKKAEERLRRQESRYRSTLDGMMEGCQMIGFDWRYVYANDAFARQAGTSREALSGKTVMEAFPGFEKTGSFAAFQRCMDERVTVRLEEACRFPGGGETWLDVSVQPVPEGIFILTIDIGERKRAERERETTIEFLRLVNGSPASRELVETAVVFFQRRSGCQAVGLRLKEGEDYPYSEARGFPPEFLLAESSLCARDGAGGICRDSTGNPVLSCMCGNVISGRFDPAKPFFTASGSFWTNSTSELLASTSVADRLPRTRDRCHGEGYESVALIPLHVGGERLGLLQLNDRRKGVFSPESIASWERLAGYFAVALAKCRAEEALRQLNTALERQVAERTALAEARSRQLHALAVQLTEAEERERRRVADLLHDDLQQILASARLQLQAAQAGLPPAPLLSGVEKLLEESIGKSRRLSHELSPAILHHAGLAASLEWLARQMKESHGLEVELEAGGIEERVEKPFKTFLFRSVQELLFNVVKHSQARKARVRLSCSGGQLAVTVSDSGQGFDARILDPAAGQAIGSGLLSIRERLLAIGGSLEVESAPGAGSRLTLTFPPAPPGAGASGKPRSPRRRPPSLPLPPKQPATGFLHRVLFVDDHRVMRQGLISMLSGQPDIQVVGEAANGREAIERARDLKPDVIVMDVSMPEMDGVEAARRIKAEMPQVRIIGLSMLEGEGIAAEMRRAGVETFVSKTDSSGSLLKAIYGMADRHPGRK